MNSIIDHPPALFALSFLVLWLSGRAGAYLHRLGKTGEVDREDLNLLVSASLTLLGLIIGFSFSMAVSRYDQRKSFEEDEANAIGTAYFRAGLLPAPDAAGVRSLLHDYLGQRIRFYLTRDEAQLVQISTVTGSLQNELWSKVQAASETRRDPVTGLAVSSMNDVLNSQGYTQAAWWNRIPLAAWGLLGTIAVCCNVLVGASARRFRASIMLVLPLLVSLAFFFIADMDSPRGGFIHVNAQNLEALQTSLPPR